MGVRALDEALVVRLGTADQDADLVAAARKEPQAFLALYDRSSSVFSGSGFVMSRPARTS